MAEKTGMSESYLTHIKNGTRRWNEDSLRKLAKAFEVSPIDLFVHQRQRTDNVEHQVTMPESTDVQLNVKIVPIMSEIPSNPSPYNNQIAQVTSGCRDMFVPVLNRNDNAMFALLVTDGRLAPAFERGIFLIVSPETRTVSGNIAAVEYGTDLLIKGIMKVTYTEDFIVLESPNSKQSPLALVRGKDHFRILGRVIERHQKFVD